MTNYEPSDNWELSKIDPTDPQNYQDSSSSFAPTSIFYKDPTKDPKYNPRTYGTHYLDTVITAKKKLNVFQEPLDENFFVFNKAGRIPSGTLDPDAQDMFFENPPLDLPEDQHMDQGILGRLLEESSLKMTHQTRDEEASSTSCCFSLFKKRSPKKQGKQNNTTLNHLSTEMSASERTSVIEKHTARYYQGKTHSPS